MGKNKKLIVVVSVLYFTAIIAYAYVMSITTQQDLQGFDFRFPFSVGSIFLFVGSLVVVKSVFFSEMKLHNVYILMSLVILSILLWVQTPLHFHDNQFHYDTTYSLSNKILGMDRQDEEGYTYYRRECDNFMHYAAFDNFIEVYADAQRDMFSNIKAENVQMVEVSTYQNEISRVLYFYLPQAIGFSLARILGLNMHWLLYMGRLFLACACVWITSRAIKNSPIFKEIFLFCGLIPTTIWSYVTVSRDALILAFSFYYISKCLQITYGKKQTNVLDYILLFGSLVLLCPYKLVYIPFVLLIGMLLAKNLKTGKWNKKHIAYMMASVCVVLIVFVVLNKGYLSEYISSDNVYSMGEDASFTISYVLTHIREAVGVVFNTVIKSAVRFYANMIAIGDYGGGIGKEMVLIETIFMILIIGESKWNNNSVSGEGITIAERGFAVLTWIAISGMILLAFLLCTPYTSDVIIGIQGRYFTPALPLMLFSVCDLKVIKKIKARCGNGLKKCMESDMLMKIVAIGLYGVALFVAVNMYVWVMNYRIGA